MAMIGKITVGIVADTNKAVRNIKKFQRSTRSMSSAVRKSIGSLKAFATSFTGIGGAITAAGIAISLKRTAERIDQVAKTSSKLGVATERLIGMQHAAEQTGVSVTTMNMALQRMTRRVAEAAKGQGEAVKALKELGIAADELNRIPLDQQLGIIADAMNKVHLQSDRVRLAMKLFDSEGVALVNTLKLGSEGLLKMQEDARKLGMTFSTEEAAKVEKFNDELDRLKKSMGGLGRRIVIDISPAASEAVQGLTLWLDRFKNQPDQSRQLPADPAIRLRAGMAAQRRRDLRQLTGIDTQSESFQRGVARIRRRNLIERSALAGLRQSARTVANVARANMQTFKPAADFVARLPQIQRDVNRQASGSVLAMALKGPRQPDEGEIERISKIFKKSVDSVLETSRRQDNVAFERGTPGAFAAQRRQEKTLDIAEQQLAEQKRSNEHLVKIAGTQTSDTEVVSIP